MTITATPTDSDFRHIAIESLIDSIVTHCSEWPPAGWCDAFDQAHSYIPSWALGGDKPHERFAAHCRDISGEHLQARRRALRHSLRQWLRSNDCAELEREAREARDAYADRETYPQDWAPYAAYLEDSTIPY